MRARRLGSRIASWLRSPNGCTRLRFSIGCPIGWRFAAIVLAFASATGCAHQSARGTDAKTRGTAPWIDDPLSPSLDRDAEIERLRELARRGPQARLVRLDRLLDLFDAARFGEFADARESLWTALGGHTSGIGDEATREAIARLLADAMALEQLNEPSKSTAPRSAAPGSTAPGSTAPAWTADDRRFLADAIMLLSIDLEHPTTAEDLEIRTLGYRELTERGHERIADNARLRLYDHARGTLRAATTAPPSERPDIAVQALYVERDDLERWLGDGPPHDEPLPPAPRELWALVEAPLAALAEIPRWQPLVSQLRTDDAELGPVVLRALPAARDPAWPMPKVPRGTGQIESLAPVVTTSGGAIVIDAGRPSERRVPLQTDVAAIAQAIERALVTDGRSSLLLALDPQMPAPHLHTLLRAIRRAQTSRIELALAEPRTGAAQPQTVVLALPVHVVRTADATAGTRALLDARIALHIAGTGPRLIVDRRPLPVAANVPALRAQLERVRRAYPREAIVRLTIASDIAYSQLVDAVASVVGGSKPLFAAVGWWAGGDAPELAPGDAEAIVAARMALAFDRPHHEIQLGDVTLSDGDRETLQAFISRAFACLPELESKVRPPIRVRASFSDGRLETTTLERQRSVPQERAAALGRCFEDEAFAMRLHDAIEPFEATLTFSGL